MNTFTTKYDKRMFYFVMHDTPKVNQWKEEVRTAREVFDFKDATLLIGAYGLFASLPTSLKLLFDQLRMRGAADSCDDCVG
jgi:hypothetical protein